VAPQKIYLVSGELEHEVGRETLDIPLDRAIERLDGNGVERCEVAVEQDLLTAQDQNGVFNGLKLHEILFSHALLSSRSRSQFVILKNTTYPP
jgi:hypothetical protein